MASKIGKALGFDIDAGENEYERKKGFNNGDIVIPDVKKSMNGNVKGVSGRVSDPDPDELNDDPHGGPDSSGPMSEPPESMDMEKPKGKQSAEVLAMRLFDKAGSPEAKVEAFRSLLEACGVTSGY